VAVTEIKTLLVAIIVALVLVGAAVPFVGMTAAWSAEKALPVRESDLGDKWPLTVSEGFIRCEPVSAVSSAVTFTTLDGSIYALNGIAKGLRSPTGEKRFLPIEPIWLPDRRPGFAKMGLRADIGPLIDLGLKLCEK
jgi:hypothetical protein